MILELEPVTSFPAVPLIHDAAQGRIAWPQAAEAISRYACIRSVALETMTPHTDHQDAHHSGKLFASRSFLQRWHSAYGRVPATIASAPESLKIYDLVEFGQNGPGERAFLHTLEHDDHAGLAVDCADGFFALLVDGTPPPSQALVSVRGLVQSVYELGRAAETESLVRRARQDVVLRMLESGNTAAFVLDNSGWVKGRNKSGQRLLGEIVHVDTGTAAEECSADDSRIGLASLLPLEQVRGRQMSIMTPKGRRVMAYAVSWKPDHSIFGSDDELLIAWDMRPYAAMVDRLGEKTTEPVSRALRETFGLTRMESVLATHLIGRDLRSAAAECGMAYETARSHLKSMFARMNIATQGELTALLSRFAYHERLRVMLSTV